MPAAVLLAIGEWAAENVVAAFLVKAIGSVLISTAINAVFSKKPSQPSASGNAALADRSQTLTSLDAARPWQIVYGQVEKGGTVVFRHTTDAFGQDLTSEKHVVPQTAPYTVTLGAVADYVSSGLVITEEWRTVGGEQEYSTVELVATGGAPAAGEYSVSAGTYTFNEAQAGQSIDIQFNKRVVSVAHGNLHLVVVFAAHECEEIITVYFNGEEVPLDGDGNATGRYAGYALVKKHLGAADQLADPTLIAAAPDKWTVNHRLRGHCYCYFQLKKSVDIYPTGLPNITVLMKGRKVYDTRSSTTAYSPNWALCQMDYVNHPTWGLGAAYVTEIDDDMLDAAANVSDEDVALAAGGTDNRYEMHGIVDTSQTPQDIIEKMLTAGAGRLVYVGGTWRLRAGAYITPTITLDEDDARGAIRANTLLSRRDAFNSVKGVHISPANKWQPADFPPVTNATYLAEDGGEPIWFDMELPFTSSVAAAQRIAKIELERVRQQITVSYPAKLAGYKVEPPETLMLTNSRFGYSSKPFELVESRLVVDTDADGNPVLGVNLSLRETASSVWDWNSSEETIVDPAPNTVLPDPRQVAPPGIPSMREEIYATSDSSGVRAKAIITWAAAPAGQAWRYEHEFKPKSQAYWMPNGALVNGTLDEIPDLAAGIYQSRVRTVSALGVRSAWSQSEYEVRGLTAAPGNVTGFSVQSYAEQAKFTWERSVDLDVRLGGRVIVRWSPFTLGADWNKGALINEDGFPGASTGGVGPLQTGTYMAKFRDSTGHFSQTEAAFVITEALLRVLSSLDFVDFHPTFAGTQVDTVVASGALQLDATTLWDSMSGSIDSWGLLDYLGGMALTGTCTFDDKLDLGSVTSARVLTTMKSEAFFTGDVWDSRFTPMDDWGLVDGDVIEDANVEIMVRVTDDDPAGTPTWGPWHSLGLVADYRCRGFEFRADFETGDVTHNRRITELTITAKE